MRSTFGIGLGVVLLAITGCQGEAGADAEPGRTPTAQPATEAELVVVDPSLAGAIDGFRTRTVVDEERHIHATWPEIPGARALNEDLQTDRAQLMADFRAEYPPPVPHQVAIPELNATWRLVGATDEVIGVLTDDYVNPGGSAAASWQTTWYDVDSDVVVPNDDLVADQDQLHEAITDELEGSEAVFVEELTDVLDRSEIPVLGFTDTGDLFVGFDEYQVAAGSAGRVSVVVPLDSTSELLSDFGERARAAALAPNIPGTATPSPNSQADPPTLGPKVDCRRLECVAITYDDGPASHTEVLLDTLKRKNATATFFVLGQQVATYPGTTRRMVDGGHEIGVHTWDHKNLTQLTPAEIHRQIAQTVTEVKTITGTRPTLVRPPYGAMNDAVRSQARKSDLALAMWSVDTEDWRDRNTPVVVRRAVGQARSGSIILMHDIHDTTVAGAGQIIDGLRRRGFTLVTVSDLIGSPQSGKTYFSQP